MLLLPSVRARGPGHFCLTLHVAMQLGLYLPGLATLSGVQSLRILDSYELFPPHRPTASATVHGDGGVEKPAKAGHRAVMAESHLSDDRGELREVRLLRREHRVALEEWNHALQQVLALSHDEHESAVAGAVRSDVAAT